MLAPVVVELDPIAVRTGGMWQAVEALAMHALLFHRSDHTLDHAILLWAMRGDELLLQPVAPNKGGVMATGKNQSVVGSQQEFLMDPAQCAETADHGMFESAGRGRCLACARQMPAEKLADEYPGSCRVIENTEANRVQFIFPDKPDADTRGMLKSNGFRWAPSENAWQRQLNNAGIYAARRVLTALGANK